MGYTDAPEGWWREFVAETPPRTGKLAVVRKDGSPHVTPVWVDLDGDALVFTTHPATIKGRSIARDGRVSVCFDDERPPHSFATVSGRAEVVDDPERVRYWSARIAARYLSPERAAAFAARDGVAEEVVVLVRDPRVVAKLDVAD
ncbi:PPOX class F420-dependent oxidoreductase [Saccharothrix sp. Mg75]|uniref:PPOX class F420-dependent oxidoreductase n=1 Tax=Saccharothrix sp. Mg75 TaxID=3445357 RepID=UPI003EECA992